MFPASGSLLAAPPFPRLGPGEVRFPNVISTMRALRLPTHAFPVAYLFRFRVPRDSSAVRARFVSAPQRMEVPLRARILVQPAIPIIRLTSCGHDWELSGFQTTHPVPLPRSTTPAEPTVPRQWWSR